MIEAFTAEHVPRRIRRACRENREIPAIAWVEPGAYAQWVAGTSSLPHVSLSFAELDRRASALAAELSCFGVEAGDRVLVLLPLNAKLAVAACAVHRLGASLVTCEGWDQSTNLGRIDAPIRCIIAPPLVYQVFGGTRPIRNAPIRIIADGVGREFDGEFTALTYSRKSRAPVEVSPDAECWLSHGPRSKTSFGALARLAKTLGTDISGGQALATSLLSVLVNLADGVTSVLPPVDLRDPDEYDGQMLIEQMRVTECWSAYLPSGVIGRLVAERESKLPLLERVCAYGEPLAPEKVAALEDMFPRMELVRFFGPHERWPVAGLRGCGPPREEKTGLSAGTLLPELEARVIRAGKPSGRRSVVRWSDWVAKPGQRGELVVYDPLRAGAYAGWESVLIGPDHRAWYRTGHSVSIDDLGALRWHRRLRRLTRHPDSPAIVSR